MFCGDVLFLLSAPPYSSCNCKDQCYSCVAAAAVDVVAVRVGVVVAATAAACAAAAAATAAAAVSAFVVNAGIVSLLLLEFIGFCCCCFCQYCCSCFCLLERALRCAPPRHTLHLAHTHATCKLDDSASFAAGVCRQFLFIFSLNCQKKSSSSSSSTSGGGSRRSNKDQTSTTID